MAKRKSNSTDSRRAKRTRRMRASGVKRRGRENPSIPNNGRMVPARIRTKNGKTYSGKVKRVNGKVKVYVTPEVARKINPNRQLSVPEKHQLRIAYQTLKMNDVMARVMGGMTKAQAKEIIYKLTGKRVN